jgi:hypothetical protein
MYNNLRGFENRVLRRIVGPKRDDTVRDWLHNSYSSPNIIRMFKTRRLKLQGHITRMGEKRNAYRDLVRYPEGKIPLARA